MTNFLPDATAQGWGAGASAPPLDLVSAPAPEDVRARPTAEQIACMEVWGDNRAYSGALSVPGIDVEVHCVPHVGGEHGGDIYYISNCAAGIITRFVLADVSGHGEEVSDAAASLRRLMRKHINTADQSRFARALSEEFGRLSDSGRFATAALLTYFAPTDCLIVCNAGHPPPLLYSASADGWGPLEAGAAGASRVGNPDAVGVPNLPLGVIEPTAYEQFAVALGRGDVVLLYSDALIEARAPGGQQLGVEGLLRLASTLGSVNDSTFRARLLDAIAEHAGGTALDDDATIVLLRHNGSEPARQTLHQKIGVFAKMLGL